MKNLGNIHVICGNTGTRKTTLIKKFISKLNQNEILIYDINKEYGREVLPPFYEFLQAIKHARNKIIIIEDATIFLKKRGYEAEIEEALVLRRHQNNYIILVFHSLKKIPTYIFELMNILTLFHTEDKQKDIESLDNSKILNLYSEVKENPEMYFNKTIILKD
jgi:hypothetical protein